MTIKASILINELRLESDLQPQRIMTNWVESVDRFHMALDQLTMNATKLLAANYSINYLGQCPVSQLFRLLTEMNRELVHLVGRTGHLPNLTNLSAHTVLLNALTTRAVVVIQLLNWSAS